MNAAPPVIGEYEKRNPWGWLLIGGIVFFLIFTQLGAYFNRGDNAEFVRAQLENELRTTIGFESLSGPSGQTERNTLAKDVVKLKPFVATSPKTAMLYAAIQTELGRPVRPSDIASLRTSKSDVEKAAFEIYGNATLSRQQASSLAKRIPQDGLVGKLVAAQAYAKAGDNGPRQALSGSGGMEAKLIAGVGVLLFGLLGGTLLFAYALLRATGKLEPKGLALGRLSPAEADKVALRCAQIFAAFLFVGIFGSAALAPLVGKDYVEIPIYILIIAIVILLSASPVLGKNLSLKSLGVTKDDLGKHILWGLGAAIANIPILVVVQLISQWVFRGLPTAEHPVTVELTDTNSVWLVLQIVLMAAVAVPFLEEIMFRGTLFPALAGVLKSPFWAGVISSIAFATIHPTGIPAWPGLAAIGGMSCFLAYQTKSLVPSMVMHAANNFAVLVLTLIILR
ncbi:MAG TPA: CPBP family intramembrane glutamic endopeptidase [Fimbriimonadaceae bacterium]|nr:CPBP family intramembrane glutamic endopeptidase [Fimbriimonadaceae bacterium]